MAQATIDRLIINSPYEEPARYWKYERETRLFDLTEGRRPAGYVVGVGQLQGVRRPWHLCGKSRWSTGFARASRRGARPDIPG